MTVIYMQGSTQTHTLSFSLDVSLCLFVSLYLCPSVSLRLSLSMSLSQFLICLSVCLYPHSAKQFHVFSFFAVNLENLRNKTNAAIVVNERLSERECLVNYFLYHKILWQNFPSCHDNKATSLKFSWQNLIWLLHLISRLERLL